MSDCDNIGYYPIKCVVQNQSYTVVTTWTVTDDSVSPPVTTPIDMTIYAEAYFDVFRNNKLLVRKTLLDGITISGTDDNILTVSLDQDATLIMNNENLDYELRLVNQTGQNSYTLKGPFSLQLTKSRNGN